MNPRNRHFIELRTTFIHTKLAQSLLATILPFSAWDHSSDTYSASQSNTAQSQLKEIPAECGEQQKKELGTLLRKNFTAKATLFQQALTVTPESDITTR